MAKGPDIVRRYKAGDMSWPEALAELVKVDWKQSSSRGADVNTPAWWQEVEDESFMPPDEGSLMETQVMLPLAQARELNDAVVAKNAG